jgi:hypothetical protein
MRKTGKHENSDVRLDLCRIEVPDDDLAAVLRTKTPLEKMAIVLSLNRLLRLRIAGHLQTHHPDWTQEQIDAEVARRLLGGTS